LALFATSPSANASKRTLAAKSEAEKPTSTKSRFLAAASHDCANPLSALALVF